MRLGLIPIVNYECGIDNQGGNIEIQELNVDSVQKAMKAALRLTDRDRDKARIAYRQSWNTTPALILVQSFIHCFQLLVMVYKERILVIEPHSDDSAIGALGYLKSRSTSHDLYFSLATASSLKLRHREVSREERISEYCNYVSSLGGKYMTPTNRNKSHSFPLDSESKLDQVETATLVNIVEEVILEVDPDEILVMGPSFHHDHTILYNAVVAATRPTFNHSIKRILVMENPTYVHSRDQINPPNFYFQMSGEQLDEKIRIFNNCFPSQIRNKGNYLSPEGIRRWSAYRGMEARKDYAEAFYCPYSIL